MSGFRVKPVLLSLILAGLALPSFAQNTVVPAPQAEPPPPERTASFVSDPTTPAPTSEFSGLATAPPALVSPPPAVAPIVSMPTIAAPSAPPPSIQPVTQAADTITKVDSTALPDVSPEAIGIPGPGSLGSDMWKGTSRLIADRLLAIAAPTRSPVLNDLMQRLLLTVATTPDGTDMNAPPDLMSLRVAGLTAFADGFDAWTLAQRADTKLIDDTTYHKIAETMLAAKNDDVCKQLPDIAKTRPGVDWQKALTLCQLAAKDNTGVQVSLDLLRAQNPRDDMFLQIADKNILGDSKTLPSQLTPLTPALLGAIKLTGLPLPGNLYDHPDLALAPVLLDMATKGDDQRLNLAEQMVGRGLSGKDQLASIYASLLFRPEDIAAPLTSVATGGRERALLYQAAKAEKDPAKRIDYTTKFIESASPALLNGLGGLPADMLGDAKADASFAINAVTVAQAYMLGGKSDAAASWFALARRDASHANWQSLWPQYVLAGMEPDSDYVTDLDKWLDTAQVAAETQADVKAAHENVTASLLLLDAAGYTVPDTIWVKVMTTPHNERHALYPAVLMERLRASAAVGRRAETVLLSIDAAQDGEISLPMAIDITHALQSVGLRADAASFARQSLALMAKTN